uniref:ethanolamine kinase n=1 Tax=Romanomermis culicivorax TaxID=13658 RepID=A0A915KPI0_ROMCU
MSIISFWANNDDPKKDRIVFRIYGAKTELIIDRKCEQLCMNIAFRNDLSPPLYCTFDNGIVYGFVPGRVIDTKGVRDITISRLIARKLAKFHSIKISQYIENKMLDFHIPVFFRLIRRFLAAWKDRFGDPSSQNKFVGTFVSKADIELEVVFIEAAFERLKSPVVFCHNDLLLNNIIYNNNEIGFIDFEYAGPNFQSFDIANHFAEFAGFASILGNLGDCSQIDFNYLE